MHIAAKRGTKIRQQKGGRMSDTPCTHESTADLNTCADEPIHVPGAIQPHGYLLVLRLPDLVVVQVSENVPTLLGKTLDDLLNQPISKILKASDSKAIQEYLNLEDLNSLLPYQLNLAGANGGVEKLFCRAHRVNTSYVILELLSHKHSLQTTLSESRDLARVLHDSMQRLHNAKTLNQALGVATDDIRKLTGYDRVMVYKFDHDWHGEIISESKADHLAPLIGQHYPASDIPIQARLLYKRNPIRLIVDVDYNSVPVTPAINPLTGKPLDMSDCELRSVSPIHVEYLKNMGAKGTLTISLMVKGELWGLIACHHSSPLNMSPTAKSACQLLGQNVALKLLGLDEVEAAMMEGRAARLFDKLSFEIKQTEAEIGAAICSLQADICELFKCCGIGLMVRDTYSLYGEGLTSEFAVQAVSMIKERGLDFFATECASEQLGIPRGGKIAGVMAMRLSTDGERWLLLYRQAQPHLINWAGDPSRYAEHQTATGRLHPRKSFELWVELVENKSIRWSPIKIACAENMRAKIIETTEATAQLDAAKNALLGQQRDDFIASIAHDMKNPLIGALRVVELIRDGKMGKTVDDLQEILDEIVLSHETLLSRIKTLMIRYQHADGTMRLPLQRLSVNAILERAVKISEQSAKSGQLIQYREPDETIFANVDNDSLSRVFENLICNAIAYAPKDGRIEICVLVDATHCIVQVTDNGPGIAPEDQATLFDRVIRRTSKIYSESTQGLGLFICKRIVEAHGGSLTCESKAGRTVFSVKLPKLDGN
jgi:chemotaxis family two-component system sensor kinase Cph1